MVVFERLFEESQPERSLLLCFSVALTHLEQELLAYLQRRGEGVVTVLVDPLGYQEGFAEAGAVGGPGVMYRLHPVDLGAKQAFHPKFYFFSSSNRLTLLIGSANLTIFGTRDNAEIVEAFTLERGDGDAGVFRDAADVLDALIGLQEIWPTEVSAYLRDAVHEIRAWTAGRTTLPGSPRLLHSATVPLIDQISDILAVDDVTEAVVISPFFDGGVLFLRELASRLPAAHLRIVGAADVRTNLNGAALRSLEDRISVERFDHLDPLQNAADAHRRLHAKALILRSPYGDWIITGSANATSAAWLRSVAMGGNFEVVVFRQEIDPTIADGLLSAMVTESLVISDLTYEAPPPAPPGGVFPPPMLHSAYEGHDGVMLHVRPGPWQAPDISLTARLQTRSTIIVQVPELRPGTADSAALWIPDPLSNLAIDEDPVIAILEARRADGAVASGRIWVDRPRLLALSGRERSARRVLDRFERQGFAGETEYRTVTGLLSDFIRDIGAGQIGSDRVASLRREGGGRDADAPGPTCEEREHGFGELQVSLEHMTAHGSGAGRGLASLIERAIAVFNRLLAPPPIDAAAQQLRAELDTSEHRAAQSASRAGEEDGEEDEFGVDLFPPLSRGAFASIRTELTAVLPDAFALEAVPALAEAVAHAVDVATGFLLHLALHARRAGEPMAASGFVEDLLHTFAQAFSVAGAASGPTKGWFLRAWTVPGGPEAVARALRDPSRIDRLRVRLAAAHTLSADGPNLKADGGSVSAGLSLVLGLKSLDEPNEGSNSLTRWMERLALRSDGELAEEDLYAALSALAAQPVPDLVLTTWWAPFLETLRGGTGALTRLAAHAPQLAALYQNHAGRRGASVRPIIVGRAGAPSVCGACFAVLPTAQVQHANRPESIVTCEMCGTLLVPIAYNDPKVVGLLRALGVMLTEEMSSGVAG